MLLLNDKLKEDYKEHVATAEVDVVLHETYIAIRMLGC